MILSGAIVTFLVTHTHTWRISSCANHRSKCWSRLLWNLSSSFMLLIGLTIWITLWPFLLCQLPNNVNIFRLITGKALKTATIVSWSIKHLIVEFWASRILLTALLNLILIFLNLMTTWWNSPALLTKRFTAGPLYPLSNGNWVSEFESQLSFFFFLVNTDLFCHEEMQLSEVVAKLCLVWNRLCFVN